MERHALSRFKLAADIFLNFFRVLLAEKHVEQPDHRCAERSRRQKKREIRQRGSSRRQRQRREKVAPTAIQRLRNVEFWTPRPPNAVTRSREPQLPKGDDGTPCEIPRLLRTLVLPLLTSPSSSNIPDKSTEPLHRRSEGSRRQRY